MSDEKGQRTSEPCPEQGFADGYSAGFEDGRISDARRDFDALRAWKRQARPCPAEAKPAESQALPKASEALHIPQEPADRFFVRPDIDQNDHAAVKLLAKDIAAWVLAHRDRVQSEQRRNEAQLTPEQAAEVERDVADLANLDMYRRLNRAQGEALIHIASVLPEPHQGTGDPRDLAKDVERQFGQRRPEVQPERRHAAMRTMHPDFLDIARATLHEYDNVINDGELAHELAMAYEAGQQSPEPGRERANPRGVEQDVTQPDSVDRQGGAPLPEGTSSGSIYSSVEYRPARPEVAGSTPAVLLDSTKATPNAGDAPKRGDIYVSVSATDRGRRYEVRHVNAVIFVPLDSGEGVDALSAETFAANFKRAADGSSQSGGSNGR